jgi:prepilin-type processing-associated H-X9-DG protein
MAQAIVCANRQKGVYAGFVYYSSDYDGVYIAPWDRTRPSWVPASHEYATQWPYTMAHYVTGGGIPTGETVYDPRSGGWYSESGRQSTPGFAGPNAAPQLHCPVLVPRGPSFNPAWYDFTSYSYGVIGAKDVGGRWVYGPECYPIPDLMTHHATTVQLMDIATPPGAPAPHAWVGFGRTPSDPHMGQSNYLFVDGHIETMDSRALKPEMWESLRP